MELPNLLSSAGTCCLSGAAVPANTAETSAPCDAAIRARVLKQPATSHKAVLPKPPGHGKFKMVKQTVGAS